MRNDALACCSCAFRIRNMPTDKSYDVQILAMVSKSIQQLECKILLATKPFGNRGTIVGRKSHRFEHFAVKITAKNESFLRPKVADIDRARECLYANIYIHNLSEDIENLLDFNESHQFKNQGNTTVA